jgi:outer membrane lipopolysaccharide assembly protein LptE/RlpB
MKPASLLLLAVLLLNMQCGYRLSGRGRNLPEAAQTIAISDFKNDTPHTQATQFVSLAIRSEFTKRSHLRLVAALEQADLVLEGRIVSFETSPISYSDSGAANSYEVRITLAVRLLDAKKNEVFYEATNLGFQETYKAASSDFFALETESRFKIAAKLAASIVTSILENF